MLIAANSQREKTAWDKIEEARRTRALLERIKQQEKLPGDMRKLVAQTLNTSPAQIGRFDAITRNLCPAFMEELKADRINISTAYELSGLSAEDQAAAFEQFRETGEISIKAARERKQDPPPAAEVPAAEHEEPEAERDEPAGEPPAPPQDAPQPATGPREADGREKIPPAAETPTGGRTETEEQPEAAGRDEPPAPPSPPSAEEERDGAEEIKRTIKQLETLKDYCEMMAESDESGSHTWTLDVDALEFAIKRLEE